jgi:hypothetical protein
MSAPRSQLVFALLVLVALLAPAGGWGQSEGTPPTGKVGIDQLLKLPETLEFDVERRGGQTRSEWRARFDEARQSVADAREGLAQAQQRLATVAGRNDNWNMAPPGVPVEAAEVGPDTYRLRDEVRRWRAEIERSEARLRELDIEASLAGVPAEWRGTSTKADGEDDSVTRSDASR